MIRRLLRLPSPSWERKLATGIHAIDDYLKELDAGLVGAKSVRRLTLLEARDFLMAAVEHAPSEHRGQAFDEPEQVFGDPQDISRRQRIERAQMFRRSMLEFGTPFGVLMLIFYVIGGGEAEVSWLVTFGVLVGSALTFGFFMALWTSYGFAPSLPHSTDQVGPPAGFKVRQTRTVNLASWLLVALFSGVFFLASIGLTGIGWFAAHNTAFNGILALVSFLIALKALFYLPFEIDVSMDSLHIHQWRGCTHIPIDRIISLDQLSSWHTLSPLVLGDGYQLCWLNENGDQKVILLSLNDELENAGRFQAMIEQVLQWRAHSNGGLSQDSGAKGSAISADIHGAKCKAYDDGQSQREK